MIGVSLGSLWAAVAFFLGCILPLHRISWTQSVLHRLMAFGSGILLGAAFLHLLPDAFQFNPSYFGLGAIAAFLTIFTIEHFVLMHACYKFYHEYSANPKHFHSKVRGNVTLWALFFHNFLDGLVLATTFRISQILGSFAAMAVLVHQFPVGVSISSIFLGSQFSPRKIKWYSFLIALFIPLGAFSTFVFLHFVSRNVLGCFLGFSAGSFIFIGATDILPEVHEERDLGCFVSFVAGVGVMALTGLL